MVKKASGSTEKKIGDKVDKKGKAKDDGEEKQPKVLYCADFILLYVLTASGRERAPLRQPLLSMYDIYCAKSTPKQQRLCRKYRFSTLAETLDYEEASNLSWWCYRKANLSIKSHRSIQRTKRKVKYSDNLLREL